MRIGRGTGVGFVVVGLTLASVPWLITRYLDLVSGEATAACSLAGLPMALFGASCIIVPFEGSPKDDRRSGWCMLIGIVLAAVETFFFGRYLELW